MHFKKGVSALASMIALGAIIVLVTGTTLWVENNQTANYVSDTNGTQTLLLAESVLQDALLKLNLNPGVSNYSVFVNGTTVGVCYYANSPSTGIYTIRTKAIKGNITRAMKALVSKDLNTSRFAIYSQEEELDSICAVTVATAPSAPLNPIWASSASGQVIINWSAPTSNGGSAITNYKVYRGVTSGSETLLTTLGNVLSYTDTGLTDNANYYYKFSAVNAIGESPLSSEVLAIPGQTPTAGTVTVSNYASGNYVGATYQISTSFTSNNTAVSCDYSINSGSTWSPATFSGSLPNYTCSKTGVIAADNTSYGITMRLTNTIGSTSATSITKIGDTVGPTVTDNWTNNWTATSPVTVTLTPTDARSGVATTKYCVDTANTCSPSTGTAGTSVSVSCTAGTACTQYVRYAAWDNVNNASAVYPETVRQDLLIPVTGTLTVTPGAYQNTLSWSGFSDANSGLATVNTYKVVYLTTGTPAASCTTGTQIYLGTGTSFVHSSLTGGTTYYYRVCAYDAVGNIATGATNSGVPTTTTTTTTTTVPTCTCGAWSTCSGCTYATTCATTGTGTQTRTCTPSGCAVESQSCTCTRTTDGTSCGTATACSLSGCIGTYTTYTCSSGICSANSNTCYASQYTSCGTATYSNCGACILNGGCTGTQTCDYTTYSCNGSGSCIGSTDIGGGQLSCTASNGTLCGSRTVWGSCTSAVSCGAYPYIQYGTDYYSHCSSGSCIEDGTCSNCESRCCTPQ